jgi:IstB-like ATP binding protein
VVAGTVEIARIEHRCGAGQALQNRGFEIVDHDFGRHTTNRAYKHWSQIFNNDSTLTSAILDRVLHHADTVIIEGKSFRMKDEIEE